MVARSSFSRNSFLPIAFSRYSQHRPLASDDVIRRPTAFKVKWPGVLTWSSIALDGPTEQSDNSFTSSCVNHEYFILYTEYHAPAFCPEQLARRQDARKHVHVHGHVGQITPLKVDNYPAIFQLFSGIISQH